MTDGEITDKGNCLPLRVEITQGRLCLEIGIDTLSFAFHHNPENNPFDDHLNDFKRKYQICSAAEFAKDVCAALNDEDEDGSTPFTRFLDSMMWKAVDEGSLGIADEGDDEPTSESD